MGDRLATIDMGRKEGRGCCAPFGGRELCPDLTQCGLGRGLPSCQVALWSIQPFGHNRFGPKMGAVPLLREAAYPSNTMWPRPMPASMPSFILIHETVWPQHTNVTDRQDRTGQIDRQTMARQDMMNRFTNGRPKISKFCLQFKSPILVNLDWNYQCMFAANFEHLSFTM